MKILYLNKWLTYSFYLIVLLYNYARLTISILLNVSTQYYSFEIYAFQGWSKTIFRPMKTNDVWTEPKRLLVISINNVRCVLVIFVLIALPRNRSFWGQKAKSVILNLVFSVFNIATRSYNYISNNRCQYLWLFHIITLRPH